MKEPVVRSQGDVVSIEVRWSSFFYIAFGLLMLVALYFFASRGYFGKALAALGLSLASPSPGAGVAARDLAVGSRFLDLFMGFIGVFFIFFEYYVLCRMVNRTRIQAGAETLTVRHGPLPWPLERGRRISVASIKSFGMASRTERRSAFASGRGSNIPFFRAEVRLGDSAKRVPLTPWFEDEIPARKTLEALSKRYALPLETNLRKDR